MKNLNFENIFFRIGKFSIVFISLSLITFQYISKKGVESSIFAPICF